jgi:hypothetical protein
MSAAHLTSTVQLETNSESSDRPTRPEGTAYYGHATYNYKKGVFIYRVEGVLCDLSETGCSIRGTLPQLVGSRIRVILSLNDQQPALHVNGATVSWLGVNSFGLKFPKLKPAVVVRLREHIVATCKPANK